MKIYLASKSPRRHQIVKALDYPIEIFPIDIYEGPQKSGETSKQYVSRISKMKSKFAQTKLTSGIVITADTTVDHNGTSLGKPKSRESAYKMLLALKGTSHQVYTSVCILDLNTGKISAETEQSTVNMRCYTHEEINEYIKTNEPFDKAGGYAIQDKTFNPVKSIEGCYLNIVGLPLCKTMENFAKLNIEVNIKKNYHTPPECKDCPLNAY